LIALSDCQFRKPRDIDAVKLIEVSLQESSGMTSQHPGFAHVSIQTFLITALITKAKKQT